MITWWKFFPAAALLVGAGVLAAKPPLVTMPLRAPLATLPDTLNGLGAHDIAISEEEIRVAGTSASVYRVYGDSLAPAFSLYVGYHAAQDQANQMHSPRNCLPGAGWQILTSGEAVVGAHKVNKYLIEYKGAKALVYYWYQGRGRVTAGEFEVKRHLFADASSSGRTEEALVRLVIPLANDKSPTRAGGLSPEAADQLGTRLSAELIPLIDAVLPAAPVPHAKAKA
jgi:EpsI family protein